tara:strand:- start:1801 stop:2484 length:684 start_codon:yes stop_codon:yes gene_type:complete
MNINEENVLAMGMCYPFAMEKARKWYADHVTVDDSGKRPKVIVHPDRDNLDKFKVVHGTTTNKWSGDAKPVFHAWVQMGDMIFDDQTKTTKPNGIDEATYYDVFSAEPKNEYTAKQAIAKCSTKGTEGPWDAKSIAKMKARDAWLGENKMNKTKLKKMIKEELQTALREDAISGRTADAMSAISQATQALGDLSNIEYMPKDWVAKYAAMMTELADMSMKLTKGSGE